MGADTAGAVQWTDVVTPYGEAWQHDATPAEQANMPGFTGHIEDSATGLTYMQARYYDPVLARFLSNDPVSFTVSSPSMFGRYAYAYNDPVNLVDPDGEIPLFALSCLANHACRGGVVGFTVELASQAINQEFSGIDLLIATGAGMVSGGLVSKNPLGQEIIDRTISVGESVVKTTTNEGATGEEVFKAAVATAFVNAGLTVPKHASSKLVEDLTDDSAPALRAAVNVFSEIAGGEVSGRGSDHLQDQMSSSSNGSGGFKGTFEVSGRIGSKKLQEFIE